MELMHENPQYEAAVDVVVYYDNNEKRFLVTSTDKNVGCYSVNSSELYGPLFKYPCEVMFEILSGISDDSLVLFTNLALNAINLVCGGNRNDF